EHYVNYHHHHRPCQFVRLEQRCRDAKVDVKPLRRQAEQRVFPVHHLRAHPPGLPPLVLQYAGLVFVRQRGGTTICVRISGGGRPAVCRVIYPGRGGLRHSHVPQAPGPGVLQFTGRLGGRLFHCVCRHSALPADGNGAVADPHPPAGLHLRGLVHVLFVLPGPARRRFHQPRRPLVRRRVRTGLYRHRHSGVHARLRRTDWQLERILL
ncbi:MAG: GlpG protein (membrane protein of glp regulon), partial [uncultured Cytophagales bacterium]